jgi:hypothetical protein
MGFYYGFKLHLITNYEGLPLYFGINNTSERDWLEQQAQTTFKDWNYLIVGDKGYQGKEFTARINNTGNYLLTGIRQSKTNKLPLATWQLHLLKLRARIETCFGKLKINYNLTNTKGRSKLGCMFNWILSIFALLIG